MPDGVGPRSGVERALVQIEEVGLVLGDDALELFRIVGPYAAARITLDGHTEPGQPEDQRAVQGEGWKQADLGPGERPDPVIGAEQLRGGPGSRASNGSQELDV